MRSMGRPRSRWPRLGLDLLEMTLVLPGVLLVKYLGWAGELPTWALIMISIPAMVSSHAGFHLWMAGGDYQRRVSFRIFVQFVLCLTPVVYCGGWGPILTITYVITAGMHMRWTGARAWRPAALWTVVGTSVGHVAIVLGLAPDNLPTGQSTVIWIICLVLSLSVIRQLGLLFSQRENAERLAAESQQATKRGEHRFQALVQNSSDVIGILGADGLVKYVSGSIETALGYRASDLIGLKADASLDSRDQAASDELAMLAMTQPDRAHTREMRLRHADGTVHWHSVTMRNMLHDPDIEGLVINHRDISESRALRESLVHDAAHDSLTGLFNRARLHKILEESLAVRAAGRAVAEHGDAEPTVAVLFIDLDGFKPVNDRFGHESGDALLIEVARLLRRSVLGADAVARIGGDEFAIVLGGVTEEADAVAVAERIVTSLQLPVMLPKAEVSIGASIGIALAFDGASASDLLRRADQAMYRAKRQGRNGWAVHSVDQDETLDVLAVDDLFEEELRDAIANDQLSVVYQPVVHLASGTMSGMEALVRWEHPTRGMLAPSEFIPVAERTGAITELGHWVLERACRQVAGWQDLLPEDRQLTLSVNLSGRELDQPGLTERVLATLAATGFPARQLVLEVTESALVDPEHALPTLQALSAAGIRIAIDDFGTGYSSLQYLNEMPVDILKLDRSFVSRLDGSPESAAIADAVVRLSETLRLGTVAEGVETEEQARALVLLGYRQGQGYHFSRPLPPQAIETMLSQTLAAAAPDALAV
jgi:diguanylate cyclase (GGDEF)-like protein/PAS domain S-box-containing protein